MFRSGTIPFWGNNQAPSLFIWASMARAPVAFWAHRWLGLPQTVKGAVS